MTAAHPTPATPGAADGAVPAVASEGTVPPARAPEPEERPGRERRDGRRRARVRRALPAWVPRPPWLRTVWSVVKDTTVNAFNNRVTGLAAEAAFFALLSLPPLVIGLVGTMGHFAGVLGDESIAEIRTWIIEQARTALTGQAVDSVVVPLVDEVIRGGSPDIVSVSFLISLWAGSRATNVYVDTITISYGLSGLRGVVRTRIRAFLLYLVGLVAMLLVIPLLVAGPTLARAAVPESGSVIENLYWPIVITVSVLFLTLLYHASVPVRTAWWREAPGAVLALVIWVVGSFLLRLYLAGSMSGVSVYGSLSAAIAVLAWLYVAAFAVLIGAALNAEIDRRWPSADTARARAVQAAVQADREQRDEP
ncbi:YihY/virulence factor BrkB family protein [Actinomadura flavalba]|uniref:YihY/virulence factor BrkB family protein n=1 Tax=Actinomadura flavalba TaxID=1120938 RepID=UPI00037AEE74|nr:YihY/virulence factor BrkB family protein [Actinomadura flavalba]